MRVVVCVRARLSHNRESEENKRAYPTVSSGQMAASLCLYLSGIRPWLINLQRPAAL